MSKSFLADTASASMIERVSCDGPFDFAPFTGGGAAASGAPDNQTAKLLNDFPRNSAAGFDPEALERGIQAMNEIRNSPEPGKIFKVILKRQETKQNRRV